MLSSISVSVNSNFCIIYAYKNFNLQKWCPKTFHWINSIIRNNKCIFTKLNAVFILKTAVWTKRSGSWITYNDKVCQWLTTDRWFSPGTPVSSTNKTECHDITEMFFLYIYTYLFSSLTFLHFNLLLWNHLAKWTETWYIYGKSFITRVCVIHRSFCFVETLDRNFHKCFHPNFN
jgi:hypothetical protein